MTFGNRIRQLRNEKGLTLEELGKIFNSSKTTISNYENDYRKPDMNLICDMANYFNVSVDYLLGRTSIRKIDNELIELDELIKQENISLSNLIRLIKLMKEI